MADKVIKGTKDRKQFQIVKGVGDTRAIRCKKCGNVASQAPDGKGGMVYKCTTCAATFQFVKL